MPASLPPLANAAVRQAWLPLAGSWLLMGLELPLVSAVMARLPLPTLSLAAYGGVVFPCSLLIESPIIMLLAASTAVARDWPAYLLVRRFMRVVAGALTLLHAVVAFTPLFDVVAGTLLGVPPETREPARLGLRLLLPWTYAIASRRTHQGVLIRTGRAHAVTLGTLARLLTLVAVLALGAWHGGFPGIAVGAAAVACGVVAEALVAAWLVRPALRELPATPTGEALTLPAFLHFYLPLSATPLIFFFSMPLMAAGMSRMPRALESLAVWPVVSGITFTLRSLGFAYNEVVVSQLERFRPIPALRAFAWQVSLATTAVIVVVAFTPLGSAWFTGAAALPAPLAALAATTLLALVPLPALSVWQSLWMGTLVHSRRTHGVTESVIAQMAAILLVLALGIHAGGPPGVYFAAVALTLGNVVQTVWLAWRAAPETARVLARDA